MSTIDTAHFRELLLDERSRVERAIAGLRDGHPGSMEDEAEEVNGSLDTEDIGETASITLGREIDYTLGENSQTVLAEIDARAGADRGRHVRDVHELRQRDRGRTAGGASVGVSLHRLRPPRPVMGERMSEPARKLDVRVGSSTDALTPVSRATRSFAPTRGQWLVARG